MNPVDALLDLGINQMRLDFEVMQGEQRVALLIFLSLEHGYRRTFIVFILTFSPSVSKYMREIS